MPGSVFVLSGEELTIPEAEIRALVQAYSPEERVTVLARRIVFSSLDREYIVNKIAKRAAYCRFGGIFLSQAEHWEDLTDDLSSNVMDSTKSFVVSSETLDRETVREIGGKMKILTGARVSLDEPEFVFDAEEIEGGYILAVSSQGFKKFSWRLRRPRARKFFLPSAIYPKLACLLVNLSRVREGELFLDPFCGTGSLLIEASLMDIRVIGIDATKWIARGALLNLRGLDADFDGVFRCDSTSELPFVNSIDAISTDVPYGRASSTKGKDTVSIMSEFAEQASRILSRNRKPRFCVVMHPSHVEFAFDTKKFELLERHFIYVHRNLTRAVSVLRTR